MKAKRYYTLTYYSKESTSSNQGEQVNSLALGEPNRSHNNCQLLPVCNGAPSTAQNVAI